MANDLYDFMDIDDEYIVQDIASQIVEFRKDNVLETPYESSLTTQEPISEQVSGKFNYFSVIVVDTNFLISHLAFLKTLIFEHAKKHNLLIIIPWIVLQELDGLKSALWKKKPSSQHEVGNLAQTAIKFLHSCLINEEEGLRGQKIYERIEMAENNDDKILDCCRYFQLVSQCPIVLLSNDKNLCVKAMVHGIITASYQKSKGLDNILEKILFKEQSISNGTIYLQRKHFSNESCITTKPKDNNGKLETEFVQDVDTMMMDCDEEFSSAQNQVTSSTNLTQKLNYLEYSSLYDSIHAPNNERSSSILSPSYTVSLVNNNYSSLEESIHAPKNKGRNSANAASNNNNPSLALQGTVSQILSDKNILSRKIGSSQEYLVTKIVSNLNDLLPPAISFHFKQSFDDHWTYVVNEPQPWSLSTMLKFMERYWFTVFSEVFQGINIETIKNMISFVSRWENYIHTTRANFTIEDIIQFVENSEIIFTMIYVGNNESAIETKQITKDWWDEFKFSLATIPSNTIYCE